MILHMTPDLRILGQPQVVPMTVTNPKHFTLPGMPAALANSLPGGKDIAALGSAIGAEGVARTGTFEETMLRALDQVSGQQQEASNLIQAAITEPSSVDAHDVTIAQAKASMSLNISRTILNRMVQGWKDIINIR